MKKVVSLFFVLLNLLILAGCSQHNYAKFQGYVEGEFTYISSSLSGKLTALAVKRGDETQQGTLLFKLDQQPESAQLVQAESKLSQSQEQLADATQGQRAPVLDAIMAQRAQATAKLKLDKKTLARYQTLYKTRAIDKAQVDAAQTAYQQDVKKISEIDANINEAKLGSRTNQILALAAAVKAAQATVTQSQWALQEKTKYAPTNARVFDTYYRLGEFVPSGQYIVSLLAPQNIKIIFFIPEPMLEKIKIGDKVSFICDNCSQKQNATIDFISPEAEYTPPVIYSRESRAKLVYRVEAIMPSVTAKTLHVGQPVDVFLTK